jgi:2-pyrone-4,6-dicarboxylate lactonase
MDERVTPTILGVRETPPTFDVPKGACDCHVHVFGPPDRFPMAADRRYTPGGNER